LILCCAGGAHVRSVQRSTTLSITTMNKRKQHKTPPTLEQALEMALRAELKTLARDTRKPYPITAQA